MTLTEEFAGPPLKPWDVIRAVICQYTDDPLLQRSLMNMVTLRHRFDHFQYVSCIHGEEQLLLNHPILAEAMAFVSKIRYAIPHFPKFYQALWNQLLPIFKDWEKHMKATSDVAFALLVLHTNIV